MVMGRQFAGRGGTTGPRSTRLRAVTGAILPAGLGDAGLGAAMNNFTTWVAGYKAGAEMSAGYGLTQVQVVPPNPSSRYHEQLADLEQRAQKRGR